MKIDQLVQDHANANKGTDRGNAALEKSIELFGLGRSVVVDRNDRLIAGNKTHKAAIKAGVTKIKVVETNGDELIVHKRMDLDLEEDAKARGLAISDNRVPQVSMNIDKAMVAEQIMEVGLAPDQVAYTVEELSISDPVSEFPSSAETPKSSTPETEVTSKTTGPTPGDGLAVFVSCSSESDQQELYDRMMAEGRQCKLSFM